MIHIFHERIEQLMENAILIIQGNHVFLGNGAQLGPLRPLHPCAFHGIGHLYRACEPPSFTFDQQFSYTKVDSASGVFGEQLKDG